MTAAAHHDEAQARAVDRLCELTSIGAGHAAGALATLLARPIEMGLPAARLLEAGDRGAELAARLGCEAREGTGVLFDVVGGLGGTLALLLTPASRGALLRMLLGESAGAPLQAESALREVGNILASHALSAIGELLGVVVLPSPPQLALVDGTGAFAAGVAERAGERPVLCIEVELFDRGDVLRALLVWAPEAIA
ncbi:MAG TPA: chemotaxis protein CheC [Myxococcota bacterium]|jgi:chemotaxis protein CheC